MADIEQKRLEVESTLKADGFAAGAKVITDSSKTAGEATVKLGDLMVKAGATATSTGSTFSKAASGIERLKREFIDGYSGAQRFENALDGVSSGMKSGALVGAELTSAIDGIVKKYGQFTDVSAAASKFAVAGQHELAAAIQATSLKYQQQAGMIHTANDNMVAGLTAGDKFRKQVLGQQFLDIGQSAALGMPLGMVAMQQGPQIAGLYAGAGGMKAMLSDFAGIAKVVGPIAAGIAGIYGAYRLLDTYSLEASMSVSKATEALAGQAAPINSLEGQIKELQSIQTAYSQAILSTATNQDAATKSIIANSQREFEAKKSLLELELKRQEAAQELLRSQIAIEGLHLKQDIGGQVTSDNLVRQGFADPNGQRFTTQLPLGPDGTNAIDKINAAISASPTIDKLKEMHANMTLTEIAADKLREALRLAFNQAPPITAEEYWTRYAANMTGLSDALHAINNPPNVSLDRVPIPTSRPVNGAEFKPIDYQSDADKNAAKTVAKTESAYQSMTRASEAQIKQLQDEIKYSGLAADARARLLGQDQAEAQYRESMARNNGKINQDEINALRQKADLQVRLSQEIAGLKFDQGQQDQLAAIRQQADMIGQSAEAQARSNAVYQANLAMRQQGISLLGQEADARRANAEALASYDQAVQRQTAAFQGLQQTEGSVIDDLLTGTGKLDDRLKAAAADVLKYVSELGANSVKNALTGTNLPTLADLFSGKPTAPTLNATNTGAMTVNAGTVMINGGFPMAPGGALGTPGSLSQVLGLTNGVRPTLTQNGVVNNPITAVNDNAAGLASILGNAGTTKTGIPLSTISANGHTAPVASQYAGNFQGFLGELQGRGYQINDVQGYNYRNIDGTNRLSNHAYGNAIDVNPALNPVTFPGRGQPMVTNMPGDVSSLASKYGLEWGGDWNSKKDPMHFEVAKGAQPMDQLNQSMSKLSTTTTQTTTNFAGLGDSTKTLQSSFADFLGGSKLPSAPGAFPPAPMGANYFPPAPTAGFNPFSLLKSLPIVGNLFSLFGFAEGGFTGNGGPHEPAGVVHGGEFVVNARQTAKFRPMLESLNSGTRALFGFEDGGFVPSPTGESGPEMTFDRRKAA